MIDAIKVGADCQLNRIMELFNMCLYDSETPSKWNNAITILLYKKGDIADLEKAHKPVELPP